MAAPEMPESSGGFSFGKLMLYALAALAVLFLLQKAGLKSVTTDEATENIDFKSAEYQSRTPEVRSASRDESVDEGTSETMRDIARQYGNKSGTAQDNEPLSDTRERLTPDEEAFYDSMKRAFHSDKALRNTPNWLTALRASRRTYRRVEAIFEAAKQSDDQTILQVLATPALADRIFAQFGEEFGLPDQMCRTFRGGKVSEWAFMIEKWRLTEGE